MINDKLTLTNEGGQYQQFILNMYDKVSCANFVAEVGIETQS